MEKNLIKKVVSVILLMVILVSSHTIYAANDSYQVKLETEKTSFLQEEFITVNVKIENIQIESGEKGLGAYTANLQYDTNLLEIEKIEGANEWETPLLQNGNMVATTINGNCTNKSQIIAKITFKIKAITETTKTKIAINNFLASNGQNDILADKFELEITLQKEEQNKNEITNSVVNETNNNDIVINNTVEDEIVITNTVNTVKNEIGLDNTVAGNKIPQTGIDNTFILVIIAILGIFVITSIGIDIYQKYQ